MRLSSTGALAVLGLLMGQPAVAQVTRTVVSGSRDAATLPFGTPVSLELMRNVNSRDAILGEQIYFQVADDVMLGGRVVIPRGARALAEVCNVRRKSGWGSAGIVEARLLYVRVGDRMVRISGRMRHKGAPGTGGVVLTTLLLWPAGAIVTGKSGDLGAGTRIVGYLDEDVPVEFASTRSVTPVRLSASAAGEP